MPDGLPLLSTCYRERASRVERAGTGPVTDRFRKTRIANRVPRPLPRLRCVRAWELPEPATRLPERRPGHAGAPPGSHRGDIHDEAVFNIAFQHPFVSGLDFVGTDHLDIRGDTVFRAEIQHLLRLGDAAAALPGR